MSNAPSPFGLPLEAGPLQGIDLGDPSEDNRWHSV